MAVASAWSGQLEWKTEKNYRWASVAPAEGKTGFTLLGPETGIAFTNILDQWQVTSNRVLQNGSGVAIGDIDGDGWQDVFFCALNGTTRSTKISAAGSLRRLRPK